MQARRILLFFGIVLLLTAAAASFVPVPEEAQRDPDETSPTDAAEPRTRPDLGMPPEPEPEGAVEIAFRAASEPESETVEPDTQVLVTVEAGEPGQVELEGLGRIQNVETGTPAVFDLFTDRTGSFDVVYTSAEGRERRVGTLIVEPAPDGSEARAAGDDDRR